MEDQHIPDWQKNLWQWLSNAVANKNTFYCKITKDKSTGADHVCQEHNDVDVVFKDLVWYIDWQMDLTTMFKVSVGNNKADSKGPSVQIPGRKGMNNPRSNNRSNQMPVVNSYHPNQYSNQYPQQQRQQVPAQMGLHTGHMMGYGQQGVDPVMLMQLKDMIADLKEEKAEQKAAMNNQFLQFQFDTSLNKMEEQNKYLQSLIEKGPENPRMADASRFAESFGLNLKNLNQLISTIGAVRNGMQPPVQQQHTQFTQQQHHRPPTAGAAMGNPNNTPPAPAAETTNTQPTNTEETKEAPKQEGNYRTSEEYKAKFKQAMALLHPMDRTAYVVGNQCMINLQQSGDQEPHITACAGTELLGTMGALLPIEATTMLNSIKEKYRTKFATK